MRPDSYLNISHRKWLQRNARQLMQRSKKTTYSYLSAQPTSRRRQTPSSVADASRYENNCNDPLLPLSSRISLIQRKCRYRQAQTRSADEPMTVSFFFRSILMFKVLTDLLIDIRDVRIVFFFCISHSLLILNLRDSCTNCNHRWKFS